MRAYLTSLSSCVCNDKNSREEGCIKETCMSKNKNIKCAGVGATNGSEFIRRYV